MDQHDGTDNLSGPPSIDSILEDLATTHPGLGFIYSALDTMASRYEIDDAIIVLTSDLHGAQMFRLKGKVISAKLASELRSQPGVYCTPDVVPQSDLDAIYVACQQALSSKFDRHATTRDESNLLGAPRNQDSELETLQSRWRAKVDEFVTTTTNFAVASRRGADALRVKSPRAYISQLLLFVDIVVFALTVAGVHGPVRLLLGLILGVAVPGWCIVGLLKLDNPPLEFGLTVAVSLSLLMVAAQVLMSANFWHLIGFEEFTCVVCLPFLWYQSRGQIRLGQHTRRSKWIKQ